MELSDAFEDIRPADPFPGRVDQEVLSVRMTDGRHLEGSLMRMGGMAFLQVRNPVPSLQPNVEGPISPDDVAGYSVLRTREEVAAERFERSRGEPVPGHFARTRDGYEARLDRLARAAAMETSTRRRQIEHQFDDVADEISLAQTNKNIAKPRIFSHKFCVTNICPIRKNTYIHPKSYITIQLRPISFESCSFLEYSYVFIRGPPCSYLNCCRLKQWRLQ